MNRFLLAGLVLTASTLASGAWLLWSSSDAARAAPDFVVTTLDNETFRLSAHRGEAIVIQFFAPWCVTCETTVRAIREVFPEWNGSNVRVLTISADPSIPAEELASYRAERGLEWPFALDTDNVTLKFEVWALGRLVVVDADGFISFDKEGTVGADQLREAVRQAAS